MTDRDKAMNEGLARAERVWRAREEMVLRLRDEGLSYDEMSARLGISAHKLRAIGEGEVTRGFTDLRDP